MRCIAFLLLLFPLALSAQEGCELFNLQHLAAENLELHDSIAQLHDSIAQFSVDTVILQPDGSFEVQLSNGSTFSQIQGCTDPAFLEYDPSANTDDGSCTSICADVAMDGYTYSTVRIGNQCWFAENLRTTVYGNGDLIPAGLTDGEWTSTTAGATAVFGEDNSIICDDFSPDIDACDEAQSLAEYGRLYNWYAVDDQRGICPVGWHVPTVGEFVQLKDYTGSQGYSENEGTALKATNGWSDIPEWLLPGGGSGNGTDDFGFSALPGGSRGVDGYFTLTGTISYWWSSDLPDGHTSMLRLAFNDTGFRLFTCCVSQPRFGYSVRCLKD